MSGRSSLLLSNTIASANAVAYGTRSSPIKRAHNNAGVNHQLEILSQHSNASTNPSTLSSNASGTMQSYRSKIDRYTPIRLITTSSRPPDVQADDPDDAKDTDDEQSLCTRTEENERVADIQLEMRSETETSNQKPRGLFEEPRGLFSLDPSSKHMKAANATQQVGFSLVNLFFHVASQFFVTGTAFVGVWKILHTATIERIQTQYGD